MSVLRNVAKVIIIGVGNALCGIGKDLIAAIESQSYIVSREIDTGFAEFIRRLDLFLWISSWVDIWSDVDSIFSSGTASCRGRQPHVKGICWSAHCSLT